MNFVDFRILIAVVAALSMPGLSQGQSPPPTQDMLLWLKADAGVITDGSGVATWEDQSGNGNNATRQVGTMQHTTSTFGLGNHDVIRFLKDGFFKLDTEPFRVPDLTVYAVVQQADTSFDDRISYFSTYSNNVNWGYGVHVDLQIAGGTPISRMFTSAGTQETISDFTMAGPSPGMHFITSQIDSTNGVKSSFADRQLLGTVDMPGLSYFTDAETASIGTLGQLEIPSFYFAGDIAEIIVYSSVDDQQRTVVESYLNDKYFGFVPENADFNGDGKVDGRDFLTWQRGFGIGTTLAEGDANSDGTVNADDLTIWSNQYGTGEGLLATIAVPEPCTWVLLCMGGIMCHARRGRNL